MDSDYFGFDEKWENFFFVDDLIMDWLIKLIMMGTEMNLGQ